MNVKQNRAKRRFVSVSARQRRHGWSKSADLSLMVGTPLRAADAAARWPTALDISRVSTDRDDLCAAYFRSAKGFNLMVDSHIQIDDHLLIVVTEGDLLIESAGVPFAVREGGSAVMPPGRWRLTEVAANSQVGYWILFFGPALLTEAIGDDEQARQLATQVTPAYRGVFVQPRLLHVLYTWGQASPATGVVQTIRAAAASMSASFYMYLREHYYAPRHALQDEIRRRWMDGVSKIGRDWPGGFMASRREFRRYHGISLSRWCRRQERQQAVHASQTTESRDR